MQIYPYRQLFETYKHTYWNEIGSKCIDGKNAHLNSILLCVCDPSSPPFFEGLIQIIAICFDFHARLHFEEEPLFQQSFPKIIFM